MTRRMFSPDIVSSDAFIEMPTSTQALYFHLGIRADDDGFVNPNITMRMVGANGDDLKILLTKKFVLRFENGVVVVKHWRINNFIRKDRYKPTVYLDERNSLMVKENGAYTLDENKGVPFLKSEWKSDEEKKRLSYGQPNGRHSVNAGKDRIGKVRIGKDSIENSKQSLRVLKATKVKIKKQPKDITEPSRQVLEVLNYFSEYIDIKNKTYISNTTQRDSSEFLVNVYGLEEVLSMIKDIIPITNKRPRFEFPHISTPTQLKENWSKIKDGIVTKKVEIKEKQNKQGNLYM